ncbi:MAG: hypothetical protein DWQ08_05140 [Proteobacteria bacterium]|nr:MAG: hypothetical protein DWQ08_05140 [Pseudomonadota bacterium]
MKETKEAQDDSGEARTLDKRETTALVLAELAYEDAVRIEAYGPIDGFVYDENLNRRIHSFLEMRGVNPSKVSFRASLFKNPDTGEVVIECAGRSPTLLQSLM